MGFIEDYKEYVKETESSSKYHLFGSLFCLSSLLGRRCWMDLGYWTVYPNLYVVFNGPAGNRKTAAMDIAYNILKEVGGINFAAHSESAQALMLEIRDAKLPFTYKGEEKFHCPLVVFATELCDFLSISSKMMIDFLTAIYDRNTYEYKTKNMGSCSIVGPSLNLLACSPPDRLTSYLRDDVVSGGFSRRTLIAYADSLEKVVPEPKITPEMLAARARLLERGRQIQGLCGQFVLDPAAREWYNNWYSKHWSDLIRSNILGYWETKHVFLFKLGMLIAVSRGDDLVIKKEYFDEAQEYLKLIEDDLDIVFAGIGNNKLNAASQNIKRFLKNNGISKDYDVRQYMFRSIDNTQYDETIKFLSMTHQVKQFTSGNTIYTGLHKDVVALERKQIDEAVRASQS